MGFRYMDLKRVVPSGVSLWMVEYGCFLGVLGNIEACWFKSTQLYFEWLPMRFLQLV